MIFSSESGFSTKSNAPSLVERTAVSMVPWPEIMMTAGGRCAALQAAESLHAVHARQPHIEENHFHFASRGTLQRFLRRSYRFDVVALVLQNRRE